MAFLISVLVNASFDLFFQHNLSVYLCFSVKTRYTFQRLLSTVIKREKKTWNNIYSKWKRHHFFFCDKIYHWVIISLTSFSFYCTNKVCVAMNDQYAAQLDLNFYKMSKNDLKNMTSYFKNKITLKLLFWVVKITSE